MNQLSPSRAFKYTVFATMFSSSISSRLLIDISRYSSGTHWQITTFGSLFGLNNTNKSGKPYLVNLCYKHIAERVT